MIKRVVVGLLFYLGFVDFINTYTHVHRSLATVADDHRSSFLVASRTIDAYNVQLEIRQTDSIRLANRNGNSALNFGLLLLVVRRTIILYKHTVASIKANIFSIRDKTLESWFVVECIDNLSLLVVGWSSSP